MSVVIGAVFWLCACDGDQGSGDTQVNTEGDLLPCEEGAGATFIARVEVPNPPEDAEILTVERLATCVVTGVEAGGDAVSYSLNCDEEGGEVDQPYVIEFGTPLGESQLFSEGSELSLDYRQRSAFESGTTTRLELREAGEVVLLVYRDSAVSAEACMDATDRVRVAADEWLARAGGALVAGGCDPEGVLAASFSEDSSEALILPGHVGELADSDLRVAVQSAKCTPQGDLYGSGWQVGFAAWKPAS